MTELYSFLFCLGLGIIARPIFIGVSALARRTNLIPVTIVLDFVFACTVGGAFIAYVILTGAVLAPYMFAALLSGYLITYRLTSKSPNKKPRK
ncbi:MAG: hypothetical protein J1F39_01465 [Clostridiales bacterium]|nr:hypothetical protein [Clostridiales bacterium]